MKLFGVEFDEWMFLRVGKETMKMFMAYLYEVCQNCCGRPRVGITNALANIPPLFKVT
jgi:hypothetical protein